MQTRLATPRGKAGNSAYLTCHFGRARIMAPSIQTGRLGAPAPSTDNMTVD